MPSPCRKNVSDFAANTNKEATDLFAKFVIDLPTIGVRKDYVSLINQLKMLSCLVAEVLGRLFIRVQRQR
jgi:hypothetical protein